MTKIIYAFIVTTLVVFSSFSQIPTSVHIQILKAEDSRSFESIEKYLRFCDHCLWQERAVLAAGRIGDERAIPYLVDHMQRGYEGLRVTAAFALGEIESIKAADAILKTLQTPQTPNSLRARAVEAAGKIAAANTKDEKSKLLGEAILDTLEVEGRKGNKQNRDTILLGLTAALRAKPERTNVVVAKFLTNPDARIRADAANTLSRIRAKNANEALRSMLMTDTDTNARANAARALGVAEDKEAVDLLIKAATTDSDSRVRVSAIRALGAIKDPKAGEPLLKRGELLFEAYKKAWKLNFIPNEHSEFLELAAALGRILANSRNERAVNLFREFGKIDKGLTPEVYIARIRVAPGRGDDTKPELTHWRQYSTLAQVVGEFSAIEPTDEEGKRMKSEAPGVLSLMAKAFAEADPVKDKDTIMAGPDVLRAYSRFKTNDLVEILRTALVNKDVQIRAAAAELISELPPSEENLEDLILSFDYTFRSDTTSNDASIATLEALFKLDKQKALSRIAVAIGMPDQVVRMRARQMLDDEAYKGVEKANELLRYFNENRLDRVSRFTIKGTMPGKVKITKLGQLLNTDLDYRRASSRKNGTVKAVLTTEKGTFTIDLLPEDAPLTVDNFIKLARTGYFNGLEVHRVVPNFVMQDGDPRGDGNGGPGWSIRCEINMVPYERGAVGMALSGKDTGGSQWFVTHSPQPHLDGGYTVFGRVNETDMKVVDNIVRGDKIISVKIVEGLPQRTQRK